MGVRIAVVLCCRGPSECARQLLRPSVERPPLDQSGGGHAVTIDPAFPS
jgi:hypothetical protein